MNTIGVERLIILGGDTEVSDALDRQACELGYDVIKLVVDPEEAFARASESDLVLIDSRLDQNACISRRLRHVHRLAVVVFATGEHTWDSASPEAAEARDRVRLPMSNREFRGVLQNALIRRQVDAERRLLERRMRVVQKAECLGVIGRHIVHDFNNVLQAMIGHVQLAGIDLPRSSPAQAGLAKAVESGLAGAALCRQFMTFALGAGQCSAFAELSAIVRETQPMLRSIVRRNVRIDCRLAGDLPLLEIPPSDVRQILFNLALNSSESFGDRRGELCIATGRRWLRSQELAAMGGEARGSEGEYVFLELADDGGGIRPDVAGRIFEPFFTTKGDASGLGLSVVRDLACGHGGAVEVRNDEGRGTTFCVFFPVPHPQVA